MRFALPLLALLGLAAAFPAVNPDQAKRTASTEDLDSDDLNDLALSKAIVDMRANPTVCVGGVR